MTTDLSLGKKSAAQKAATYIEDGMTLGIGTGSTAKFFIDALAEKIAGGWTLRGVPTSIETHKLAEAAGVEIIEPSEDTVIDLAVDGADEADPALNLIKGGGAALLREKIVACAAKRFIMIADISKRVDALGAFPLPIEVERFGAALTVSEIRRAYYDLGFEAPELKIREKDSAPVLTDGGNLIVDCAAGPIRDPRALEDRLSKIPGVVESGLFCGLTNVAIFGDGEDVTVIDV